MRKLAIVALLTLTGCGPGMAGAWQQMGHGVSQWGQQSAQRRHERNLEYQRSMGNAFNHGQPGSTFPRNKSFQWKAPDLR